MPSSLLFLLLIIPGTFFLGVYDVLIRKILKDGVREGFLAGIVYTAAGIFLFAISIFWGFPVIKSGFWAALAVTATINIFSELIWFKAFKREEASLISPLRLLTPPLVLLTGFLVLQEVPSAVGVLGVFITILGLWLLLRSESNFHARKLKDVLLRSGVLLGILGAVLNSITFPFDKLALTYSSALFFVGLSFTVVGLGNILLDYWRNSGDFLSQGFLEKLAKRDILFLILTIALAGIFSVQALNFSLAAYNSSVKRLWSFWAVILGGQILREKNIRGKLLAVLVMFAGIVLSTFFG